MLASMRYYLTEQIGSSLVVVAEVIGRVDPHTGKQIPHSWADLPRRMCGRSSALTEP
jgi:hypothetical protein